MEYTDLDEPFTDRELVDIFVGSFGEYVATGLVERYQIRDMFKIIYGDSFVDSIYERDDSDLSDKIIGSVLSLFRLSRVKRGDEILVDFGQYEENDV
jgi:hypothetical protein